MKNKKRVISILLALVMFLGCIGNGVIAETETTGEPTSGETLNTGTTEARPTDPLPTDPLPTDPLPTDPLPTDPLPTDPLPTDSLPTDSLPTDLLPTDPLPTDSLPTDPLPTDPLPTDPGVLEDTYIYVVDDKEIARQEVADGDMLAVPLLDSREPDYTFTGWFIAGSGIPLDLTKTIAVDTGGQVIEVRAVFVKVEAEPIDEEAYGPQIPYAPVLLSGSVTRLSRSFAVLAAGSSYEVDPAIPDASLTAGQFKLNKSAALVPGKVNEWEVTLRVTGKQSETYSDVVLVIDRSGSMAGDKLVQAKAAANLFIDTVLARPNTRIAVVSFSDTITKHGAPPYFSADAATLHAYVNSLSANGFTHL